MQARTIFWATVAIVGSLFVLFSPYLLSISVASAVLVVALIMLDRLARSAERVEAEGARPGLIR